MKIYFRINPFTNNSTITPFQVPKTNEKYLMSMNKQSNKTSQLRIYLQEHTMSHSKLAQ